MAAPRIAAHPTSQAPLAPSTPARGWLAYLRARLRPARRLKLTREGKYFIAITFGVGILAINTANNLLYLLLGMLLSLIIVSGVLSEISLRHLTVIRRLPPRAQVGRPHLVEIEVFNHKRSLPSYAIEIEDLRDGQPADKRCFFLKISPRSAQIAAYRRTPARRGRDRHVGFRVATRFPFGLFEKSRELAADGELIIYPAVDPVRLPAHLPGRVSGGPTSHARGVGDEIVAVRPMRESDDPRDIYWRKSTLANHLVVRERPREARNDVDLRLDDVYPTPPASDDFLRRFEHSIRDVASHAVAHLRRGDSVRITLASNARVRASPAVGADPILRFLALLDPTPRSSPNPTPSGLPIPPPFTPPRRLLRHLFRTPRPPRMTP
ncbi:MAG: DUF58 domain-containing protein [Polyangiaceae bacterium]|nr:DUF58 domain-containing protein [Polyangiaceae bacterium]